MVSQCYLFNTCTQITILYLPFIIILLFIFNFRYLDRIIKSNELQEFSEMLQSHQKAVTLDGKLQVEGILHISFMPSTCCIEICQF